MLTKEQFKGLREGDLLKVVDNSTLENYVEVNEIVIVLHTYCNDIVHFKRGDGLSLCIVSEGLEVIKEKINFEHKAEATQFNHCNHDFRPVMGLTSILGYSCKHCDKRQEDLETKVEGYVSDDVPF
jgi:hypothetical protein